VLLLLVAMSVSGYINGGMLLLVLLLLIAMSVSGYNNGGMLLLEWNVLLLLVAMSINAGHCWYRYMYVVKLFCVAKTPIVITQIVGEMISYLLVLF